MSLLLLCLPAILVVLLLSAGFLASRPRPLEGVAPELFIAAAHSDDCVIMAAEPAVQTLEAGGRITIFYLTCSADSPENEIARQRADEARTAWALLTPDRVEMHWFNLPQSPVPGPRSYDDATLSAASSMIAARLQQAAEGAWLVVPAANELHIDHRAMRKAALAAANGVGRSDLRIVETTEYNSTLSLLQDPLAVLHALAGSLPRLGQLLPRHSAAPVFVSGEPGWLVPADTGAFARKLEMFEAFRSQDPAVLRHFFSWRSRYRDVGPVGRQGIPVLGRRVDASVMLLIAALLGCFISLGYLLAGVGGGALLALLVVLLGGVGLAKQRSSLWAIALALGIGGIAEMLHG